MAEITLVAESGRTLGSRPSKRLRREGKVPGVVYGQGVEPTSVAVNWRELRAVLTTEAGLNALIRLEYGDTHQMAIVKEMQRHPVRRSVEHVDFLVVDVNQPVAVDVPIVLVGEAEAVLDEKGVVDQTLFTLHVNALPTNIPNEFEVDISGLTLDTPIRVGDIVMPEGVTCDVDPEEPVVTGQITRAAIEDEEGEAAEGAEGETAEGDGEEAAEGGAGEAAEGGDDAEAASSDD